MLKNPCQLLNLSLCFAVSRQRPFCQHDPQLRTFLRCKCDRIRVGINYQLSNPIPRCFGRNSLSFAPIAKANRFGPPPPTNRNEGTPMAESLVNTADCQQKMHFNENSVVNIVLNTKGVACHPAGICDPSTICGYSGGVNAPRSWNLHVINLDLAGVRHGSVLKSCACVYKLERVRHECPETRTILPSEL